jgi:adenylosuccinate lyase
LAGVVGSITMPHKRNPEVSEHLGTLARIVRHEAAVLLEGTVHDHERDGRAWKAEWLVVPEITLLAGRAAELMVDMANGLSAHPERMLENLRAAGGSLGSEALMLALATRTGRETAHRLVYAAAERARAAGRTLAEETLATAELMCHLTPAEVEELLDPIRHTGQCGALVDQVLSEES